MEAGVGCKKLGRFYSTLVSFALDYPDFEDFVVLGGGYGKFPAGTLGATDHGQEWAQTPEGGLPDQGEQPTGGDDAESKALAGIGAGEQNPYFRASGHSGGNRQNARGMA